MTHNLSDKNTYPSHHLYVASSAINIYSKVKLRRNDKAIINGKEYRLGVNRNLIGCGRKSNYHKGNVRYYEFTVEA